MLARLQQAITLTLLAGALWWMVAFWHKPWLTVLAGPASVLLGYGAVMAAEFVVMVVVSRKDNVPRPSWSEVIRAWLGEVLTAPRVFCWWQPFRSQAVPDHLPDPGGSPRRGVVLVHGFVCNRGLWTPWLHALTTAGHPFVAVNLEPVFGAIDDYAPIIDDAVRRVTAATGQPPLVVCHSMGGLAVRAWLRTGPHAARVHHVVTIGTPHRGTWLSHLSFVTNGSQMRLDGDWMAQLGGRTAASRTVPFTCWYGNCDNIVFPASSACLPGADNRLVRGVAHVHLAFHPEVMQSTLRQIAGV